MIREMFDTVISVYKPILLVIGICTGLSIASGDDRSVRASQIAVATGQTFSCNSTVGGILCAVNPVNWFK